MKIEKDDCEEFLLPAIKAKDLANKEEVTEAGEYILKRKVNLVNSTEIHQRTPK